MKWTGRLFGHRHERAEDYVEELRRTAAALAETESESGDHEEALRAAHEAQHEAERSVAKAVEARMALHNLVEKLRAGPTDQDRFAQEMKETFKDRRREERP